MKRNIYILFLCILAFNTQSQIVNNSRFRPFSYEEMIRALPPVSSEMIERAAIARAQDRAEREAKFEKWQSAAVEAYNKGDYFGCLTYINYALETNFHNGYIYYVRGLAFENLHDYKNAKKQYKKAKDEGYYQAEELLKGIKDREKAWKQSQKPNSTENRIKQAEVLFVSSGEKFKKADYAGAYDDVVKSVDLYPTPQSQYARAFLAYYQAHNFDDAIKSALFCVDNSYEVDNSFDLLVNSYYAKEDYSKCIQYLDKQIQNDRKNVAALLFRAYIKSFHLDDDMSAKKDYLELINYDGIVDYDYSYAYNMLAYWALQDNDFVTAEKYVKSAIKNNHLYGNAWDTYGELYYKLGKYKECFDCMNKAIVNGKTMPTENAHWLGNSYFYRGLAKKQFGNLVGAYKDIERAKELGEETAQSELNKIDASKLDFSEDGTFSVITREPKIQKANDHIKLRAVEQTEEYTALHFSYTNTEYPEGGWYAIESEAYIRNRTTGDKLILIGVENCDIMPKWTSIALNETKTFSLYFPPIPKGTKEIDMVENDSSEWKFFGIQLEN